MKKQGRDLARERLEAKFALTRGKAQSKIRAYARERFKAKMALARERFYLFLVFAGGGITIGGRFTIAR